MKSKLRKTPAIIGTHNPLHSFHISPFYFLYIYFNIILACKYVSEEPLSFAFYYEYQVVCYIAALVTVCYCPNNAPADTQCHCNPNQETARRTALKQVGELKILSLTIQNYQRDALNIIYSSNIITLLYMFRVTSTHLQEDIVVHKQHMVPSLSIRVLVSC